ncbi:MAG: hypothetical protein FWH12_06545 [Treponema sp.]|nr:hypothetical protein [Treponema sp.]
MSPEKLSALLSLINPAVIKMIMDSRALSSIEATKMFYNSDLYAMMENESSKVWQLSPLTLFELLEEELATGSIKYPEA